MPKSKPKPMKKAAAVKRPSRVPLKKTKPRMREATHRKPTKKARATMNATADHAKDKEQRGAGSGEHAVATRSRQPHESATEYAKGDIAKGRIDYEKLSEGQTAEIIPMRDRRAYLIDQAEKNEAANDELNAIQVEQIKRLQFAQNQLQDPDVMREESMETAVAALKMHDPDERKKSIEAERKYREKNAKIGGNPNSADFKAGQAVG